MVSVAKMTERSVIMSFVRAGKSDKARACRREQYARARISAQRQRKEFERSMLPLGGITGLSGIAKCTF